MLVKTLGTASERLLNCFANGRDAFLPRGNLYNYACAAPPSYGKVTKKHSLRNVGNNLGLGSAENPPYKGILSWNTPDSYDADDTQRSFPVLRFYVPPERSFSQEMHFMMMSTLLC